MAGSLRLTCGSVYPRAWPGVGPAGSRRDRCREPLEGLDVAVEILVGVHHGEGPRVPRGREDARVQLVQPGQVLERAVDPRLVAEVADRLRSEVDRSATAHRLDRGRQAVPRDDVVQGR